MSALLSPAHGRGAWDILFCIETAVKIGGIDRTNVHLGCVGTGLPPFGRHDIIDLNSIVNGLRDGREIVVRVHQHLGGEAVIAHRLQCKMIADNRRNRFHSQQLNRAILPRRKALQLIKELDRPRCRLPCIDRVAALIQFSSHADSGDRVIEKCLQRCAKCIGEERLSRFCNQHDCIRTQPLLQIVHLAQRTGKVTRRCHIPILIDEAANQRQHKRATHRVCHPRSGKARQRCNSVCGEEPEHGNDNRDVAAHGIDMVGGIHDVINILKGRKRANADDDRQPGEPLAHHDHGDPRCRKANAKRRQIPTEANPILPIEKRILRAARPRCHHTRRFQRRAQEIGIQAQRNQKNRQ